VDRWQSGNQPETHPREPPSGAFIVLRIGCSQTEKTVGRELVPIVNVKPAPAKIPFSFGFRVLRNRMPVGAIHNVCFIP
jgi:hypothetical protein